MKTKKSQIVRWRLAVTRTLARAMMKTMRMICEGNTRSKSESDSESSERYRWKGKNQFFNSKLGFVNKKMNTRVSGVGVDAYGRKSAHGWGWNENVNYAYLRDITGAQYAGARLRWRSASPKRMATNGATNDNHKHFEPMRFSIA